jgi:hypothetical protein
MAVPDGTYAEIEPFERFNHEDRPLRVAGVFSRTRNSTPIFRALSYDLSAHSAQTQFNRTLLRANGAQHGL